MAVGMKKTVNLEERALEARRMYLIRLRKYVETVKPIAGLCQRCTRKSTPPSIVPSSLSCSLAFNVIVWASMHTTHLAMGSLLGQCKKRSPWRGVALRSG